MSSGGTRPGAGRKPGSRNRNNAMLLPYVKAAPGGDLAAKLTAVSEDATAPIEVRIEAMRRLFGWLSGRTFTAATPNPERN